jgi:tetratricopeptide (TPR) repeat protein
VPLVGAREGQDFKPGRGLGNVRVMTMPATLAEVAAAVLEVLADGRARTVPELRSDLQRQRVDLGSTPERAITELLDGDDLGLVLPLGDGRYVDVPALLTGRVFTHRLTAAEVAAGFLSTTPDLEALSMLTEEDEYRHLLDGSALAELLPGFDDRLLLDRGIREDDVSGAAWLVSPDLFRRLGLTEGDLVGVSLQPGGFAIEPVTIDDPPAGLDGALASWVGRLDEAPEQLDTALWMLCADDPAAFTSPPPPVGELLTGAGLIWDGDLVMTVGFDLAGYRVERRIARAAELYDLDDDEALAVLALSRMYERVADLLDFVNEGIGEGASLEDVMEDLDLPVRLAKATAPAPGPEQESSEERQVVRALLPLLAEPAVATAVLAETLGIERDGAAALGVFTDSLEPLAPPAARPAVRWLRGRAHDRMGRAEDAEAAYEAALALDPTYPLALNDLARIASDRGDAGRGLSLLRRAGDDADEELVAVLEHFRPFERSDLGRNAPCWCGSGRKYKVCHRGREQQPLEERAAWLYQKAGGFLQAGPWRLDLLEIARIRAAHFDHERALLDALQDPLVADAVLFEGGAFEEFLQQRGSLLPEDERLLAAQWVLCERSLFEIETVQPGIGFTARDLRTGDELHVRERLGSRQLKAGMLICARLVPAGETFQGFGGYEPIELSQRDRLLSLLDAEPTAADLVATLSARFAPPQLQNTESEPLVLCEAVLHSPDPAALSQSLDEAYRRTDDHEDSRCWHEYVTTHGSERIRASLRLTGADVTVETNSETRQDRVLGTLRTLQPGLELLRETRHPAEDLQEAMSRAPLGLTHSTQLDPADPLIAAALDEFVKNQERIWLDQPVPVLGGITPRAAAADPTRRDDLIRLLDSYPPAAPGLLDPTRLRDALGL